MGNYAPADRSERVHAMKRARDACVEKQRVAREHGGMRVHLYAIESELAGIVEGIQRLCVQASLELPEGVPLPRPSQVDAVTTAARILESYVVLLRSRIKVLEAAIRACDEETARQQALAILDTEEAIRKHCERAKLSLATGISEGSGFQMGSNGPGIAYLHLFQILVNGTPQTQLGCDGRITRSPEPAVPSASYARAPSGQARTEEVHAHHRSVRSPRSVVFDIDRVTRHDRGAETNPGDADTTRALERRSLDCACIRLRCGLCLGRRLDMLRTLNE